jgi:hypothetical protein
MLSYFVFFSVEKIFCDYLSDESIFFSAESIILSLITAIIARRMARHALTTEFISKLTLRTGVQTSSCGIDKLIQST